MVGPLAAPTQRRGNGNAYLYVALGGSVGLGCCSGILLGSLVDAAGISPLYAMTEWAGWPTWAGPTSLLGLAAVLGSGVYCLLPNMSQAGAPGFAIAVLLCGVLGLIVGWLSGPLADNFLGWAGPIVFGAVMLICGIVHTSCGMHREISDTYYHSALRRARARRLSAQLPATVARLSREGEGVKAEQRLWCEYQRKDGRAGQGPPPRANKLLPPSRGAEAEETVMVGRAALL